MPTSTTITFTGLLVFHPDPKTGQFDVGVLRARDAHEPHFLQIEISPDPGQGPIPQQYLERIIQNGNDRWELEVDGSSTLGIEARLSKPPNRHDATQNERDFGWIINLENDEFHGVPLARTPKALQPVIRLRQGELFTSCKTDSIVTIQGPFAQDFGFILGGIGLTIDTSAGQQPVLSFINEKGKKEEIFRLTRTDQVSYQVSFLNTPPPGTPIKEGHFHLYYDRLFKGVAADDRFDLKLRYPTVRPHDRCPEAKKKDDVRNPNPFKCGGIMVESGDDLS
jgi:hypothetical protein